MERHVDSCCRPSGTPNLPCPHRRKYQKWQSHPKLKKIIPSQIVYCQKHFQQLSAEKKLFKKYQNTKLQPRAAKLVQDQKTTESGKKYNMVSKVFNIVGEYTGNATAPIAHGKAAIHIYCLDRDRHTRVVSQITTFGILCLKNVASEPSKVCVGVCDVFATFQVPTRPYLTPRGPYVAPSARSMMRLRVMPLSSSHETDSSARAMVVLIYARWLGTVSSTKRSLFFHSMHSKQLEHCKGLGSNRNPYPNLSPPSPTSTLFDSRLAQLSKTVLMFWIGQRGHVNPKLKHSVLRLQSAW